MKLKFIKMHGLGNDFILIDATLQKLVLDPKMIQALADRRTGIGFDQLLLIEPSASDQVDFLYRIFNANGQEVEQCGNGARCVAHYIFTEGLSKKSDITLATVSGKIELKKAENNQITVNMGRPHFAPAQIPFLVDKEQFQYELQLEDNRIQFGAVSMGNPHVVLKVKDVLQAPVQQIGQLLQHHPAFPKQVNVGFMEIISPHAVRLRVYERGVGETRACGSGACAATVIGRVCYNLSPTVNVELPGGNLMVNWPSYNEDVYLTGPAEKVYKGEVTINPSVAS
jgi:diaminopimelate epimerase